MWTRIKRHRGKVIVGLIILIASGVVARQFIFKPPPHHQTATAEIKDLTNTLDVSGEIKATKQAVLKFQTPGKLAWVGVQAGDPVHKWQAVASLDKSILKKQLEKYLNDYMGKRWDFDQIRETNLVTTDNYDEYSFSNAIERSIEQQQFLLNKTVSDVEIQAITNRWATLVSPIQGIVTNIDTPVAGVNVGVTDAFTIVDPKSLYFEAEVDQSDINHVSIGQTATITFEAFPDQTFNATITHIDFASSISDSGGTVFKIWLTVPLERVQFRLGMTGDASIVLEKKTQVLTLPTKAITQKDGKTTVKINENGQLKDQEVTTGLESDDDTEITGGLSKGSEVIISETKAKK